MSILNKIYQDDAEEATVKEVATKQVINTLLAREILVRPVISEKSALASTQSKYVFEVSKNANKFMVANAVAEKYGVRPVAVRVSTVPSKTRYRKNIAGKIGAWKKATVTLPAGKSITVVEGL